MTHKVRILLLAALISGIMLPGSTAFASSSTLPALNPPPPSFLACRATGSGAICEGRRQIPEPPVPFGIFCGSTADPIELIETDVENLQATRYYDAAGNLTRRHLHEYFEGTITNPVTGLSANLTQLSLVEDTLAVPGDLNTATERDTGTSKFYLNGAGVLVHDAGITVFAPNGEILRQEGQHDLDAYFVSGDRSVMAALCAALGSPGTP